jgi:ribonuclease HI
VVAELRAAWRAVSALIDSRFARANITVLTDSSEALDYLRKWQAGQEVYPAGYQLQRLSGRRSSLEQLAEQLRHDGNRYTLSKVRGHAGHHLNEAADSLARLALRCGTRNGVTQADAHKAASAIAAVRLADYWKEEGLGKCSKDGRR